MEKITLDGAFATFTDYWNPHVAGNVNNMLVKLVKFQGEFVWHHHDAEDELFLVHAGRMTMRFRDKEVSLGPGEFIIVPKGVEHCPAADDECQVLLFEPNTTLNTGNLINERTREQLPILALK